MNLRIAGVVKQDYARGCGTRVGGAVLDNKIKKLIEEGFARFPKPLPEREAEIRVMLKRYQEGLAELAFESLKEMRRRGGLTKELASRVWLS